MSKTPPTVYEEYPNDMPIADAILKELPDRVKHHEKWIQLLQEQEDIETVQHLRDLHDNIFESMNVPAALKSGLSRIRGQPSQRLRFGKSPLNDYDIRVKLLIVGDTLVGKTSLLLRYTDGLFPNNPRSTVGIDYKTKTKMIEKKNTKIEVYDTGGCERFKSITASYYRGAQGVALVFDLTNKDSLINIASWMDEIRTYCNEKYISLILIGNKCDLEEERQVKYEHAYEFAKNWKMKYFECSAKNATDVEKAFTFLIKEIIEKKTYATKATEGVFAEGEGKSWCCMR